ncbi:MAG: alpha/beta fold hydrolase [Chloroflexota bacterium]|nr:alpha/beta fold hydrolase [Chloroflexota bacterium]
MSIPILPGAEPISIADGPNGAVLLLHGYMGTVQTVRDWAMAFAEAGFAVEAPLLPGHGTSSEDMADTQWSDYVRCADTYYRKLVERHQRVFVGGLCLGGPIAAWVTAHHPETTSGLIVINGNFKLPKQWKADSMRGLLDTNRRFFPWFRGKTVEDPNAPPLIGYEMSPIAPMLSLKPALIELYPHLSEIHCPVLVFTSLLDTVLAPDGEKPWFEEVSGPVEHILLERSRHVATLDYDKRILEARSVAFALAITQSERDSSPKEAA